LKQEGEASLPVILVGLRPTECGSLSRDHLAYHSQIVPETLSKLCRAVYKACLSRFPVCPGPESAGRLEESNRFSQHS